MYLNVSVHSFTQILLYIPQNTELVDSILKNEQIIIQLTDVILLDLRQSRTCTSVQHDLIFVKLWD